MTSINNTSRVIETQEANASDIPELAALANEIWHEHFATILSPEQIDYMVARFQSEEAMKRQTSSEGYAYRFLVLDGEHVGYFAYVEKPNDEIFLSKVYVRKDARRNGLARLAIEWLSERGRAINARRIWLTVNKYNSGSIACYKNTGFTTFDEDVTDIGNGFVMDDYFMEKIL